jgi:hypothetical protein
MSACLALSINRNQDLISLYIKDTWAIQITRMKSESETDIYKQVSLNYAMGSLLVIPK